LRRNEERLSLREKEYRDEPEEDILADDRNESDPGRNRSVFRELCNVLKNFVSEDGVESKTETEFIERTAEEKVIIQTDKDLKVQYISTRCMEDLSLGEDVVGQNIAKIIFPKGAPSGYLDDLKRSMESEGERFRSLIIKDDRSGSPLWHQYSIEKFTDDSGAIEKLIWTCKDVTGSVIAGGDSKKEGFNMKVLFDALPFPVLLVSSDGRPKAWNLSLLEMFGLANISSESLFDRMMQKVENGKKLGCALFYDSAEETDTVSFALVNGIKIIGEKSSKKIDGNIVWTFRQDVSDDIPAATKGRNLVDNLPVNILEIDAGFKVLSVTKGIEAVLGHSSDDMVGYSLFNLVCDEDREKLKLNLKTMTSKAISIEARMLKADGEMIWTKLDCQKIPGEGGVQAGYMICIGDVSDRKFMERSLEDLAYIFNFLMNHMHEGVWIIDQDFKLVQWNVMMESISGIHSSDALGKPIFDLAALCEGFDKIAEAAKNVIEKKRTLPFNNQVQISLTPKNGVPSEIVIEMSQMMTEGGRVVLGVCSLKTPIYSVPVVGGTDVFKQIVDNSPDLIMDVSIEGEVIYSNRTAERLVGKDSEYILSSNIKELFINWPAESYRFPEIEMSGDPFDLDIVDTEGRIRTYHISRISFDKETSTSQFYGREITEVLETRKMLGTSEEMKKLLLETHPAPVVLTDALGRVVYMNYHAKELFGFEHEATTIEKILDPVGLAVYTRCLEDMQDEAPMKRVPIDFRDKNGVMHKANIEVGPIADLDGSVTNYLITFREVDKTETAKVEAPSSLPLTDDKIDDAGGLESDIPLEGPEPALASDGLISSIEDEVDQLKIELEAPSLESELTGAEPLLIPTAKEVSVVKPVEMAKEASVIKQVTDFDIGMSRSSAAAWIPLREICNAAMEDCEDDMESMGMIDNIEIFAEPGARRTIAELVDNSFEHGGAVTRIDVKFFIGDKGGFLVIEDDGKGIAAEKKGRLFDLDPVTGAHSLFNMRQTLGATGILIDEVSEPGNGARFEIFIPDDKFRRMK